MLQERIGAKYGEDFRLETVDVEAGTATAVRPAAAAAAAA